MWVTSMSKFIKFKWNSYWRVHKNRNQIFIGFLPLHWLEVAQILFWLYHWQHSPNTIWNSCIWVSYVRRFFHWCLQGLRWPVQVSCYTATACTRPSRLLPLSWSSQGLHHVWGRSTAHGDDTHGQLSHKECSQADLHIATTENRTQI